MAADDIEAYDFVPSALVKGFAIAASVVLLLAIVLGSVSAASPNFLRVVPTIVDLPTGLKDSFNTGYFKVCYDKTGCEDLSFSTNTNDQEFNRLVTYRAIALALHITSLVLGGLVFIGCIVLFVFWFKRGGDHHPFRISRLVFGSVLIIAAIILQVAILLFHFEQFEDKWSKSTAIPYGFVNWAPQQRTTTSVTLSWSYLLIWVTNVLLSVSGWMLAGSFCCWSHDFEGELASQISVALPRLPKAFSGMESTTTLIETPTPGSNKLLLE